MLGPLGFATKNLSRRGFHSFLAFLGLTLTITSTTFLLLLGQGLVIRLGAVLSPKGTFGIDWLLFGYLILSLIMIIIVGIVSTSYLVSSMISQRIRDIGVIKAAGALPRRLVAYTFTEAMLVVSASCLAGAMSALAIYVAWAWPSVDLFTQVGPVPEAGATIILLVPLGSFLLSFLAARFRLGRILRLSASSALNSQLSGVDLNTLGKPAKVRWFGSAFNLATRNVSRDRELNRTLVRIMLCVFLSVLVLTGALASADTSRNYVQRAMPAGVILVADAALYGQYVRLGTAFSNVSPIPSFSYTNTSHVINQTIVSALRSMPGVERVDARLITMASVNGYVKAHLVTNETSGNYNNEYVPQQYLGSARVLMVGIDASNAIGDWYTSDGFLQPNDNQTTIVAGDSLVGDIVQSPFSLAQVGALGVRYDVKGGVVDPLNGGRVIYAQIQSLQRSLNVTGYNLLLVKTSGNAAVATSIEQFLSSNGLMAGSMDQLLRANISFLNNTWSYVFVLPSLALALTCGVLLGYLTTNFSRRFNDYVLLRVLGAKAWFSLRLLLWEAWGLLAVCTVIAAPLAWLVSFFFLLPETSVSATDQVLGPLVSVAALSAVSIASAIIYSGRLRQMTVKDLRL